MQIYFFKKNYFSHQKLAFIENTIFFLDHRISFRNRYYTFQIAYDWMFSLTEGFGDNQVLVHKITVFAVKNGTNAPRNRYFKY
jgi:hypothetical protein